MAHNLLGIPETLLPVDPAAAPLLANDGGAADPRQVAGSHPACTLAWAMLAEEALAEGNAVDAYAYARTGYHRSLDSLRRAGWRGQGPVPWRHEPNRGFLRSLAALARAAQAVGETEEYDRCSTFLRDTCPDAADALGM